MNRISGTLTALLGCAALASCSAATNGGSGGDYPSRTINLIVPVPAGSSTDVSTRFVVDCLEKELDATIVVENREGGGGAVGLGEFARAKADGYTLASTAVGNALVPPIAEGNVGYDANTFAPVGLIGQAPIVLIVKADSPYGSAEELLDAAKTERISVGTPSPLSVPGISMSSLVNDYDLQFEAIPFEGNSEVVTALISGEVDAAYISADGGVTLPRIESGEVNALATAVDEPPAWDTDLPTLDSLGFSDLPNGDSFWFLSAHQDTPEDVQSTLAGGMETCMTDAGIQDQIGEYVAPEEFVGPDEVSELLSDAAEGYESSIG